MSKKKKVIIIAAIVSIFAVLGGFFYVQSRSVDEADKFYYANWFVEDISAGSIETAYLLISDELEEQYYLEDLVNDVKKLELDESCELTDVDMSEENVLTARIQCDSKSFENVRFEFNPELDITSFAIE